MDKYIGYDRPINRRIHYLSRIFKEQLRQYGKNILLDNEEVKGIIKNNQNPHSENKEDRVLEIPLNIKVRKGSYIKHDDVTYMAITDIDKYEVSQDCKIRKCGCIFKWQEHETGEIIDIPCIVSYQSYGVKIFQATNDFFNEVSTNIDVQVQRNEITEKIPVNFRMCFGNSEHGIYKVGDIATYSEGILKFTCKKDKYLKGYDNLETGEMWQKYN